jgi:hypothetical protein
VPQRRRISLGKPIWPPFVIREDLIEHSISQ